MSNQKLAHYNDSLLYQGQILEWVRDDSARMEILQIAQSQNLNDWCIGAGFVRNLVWDHLHDYETLTKLNDIDLIYFDPDSGDDIFDDILEVQLQRDTGLPWSIKNQAKMHNRNHDRPYTSTEDGMRYWVEVESAVGVRLEDNGELVLLAPFGVEALFQYSITINPQRPRPRDLIRRVNIGCWLDKWPRLTIKEFFRQPA